MSRFDTTANQHPRRRSRFADIPVAGEDRAIEMGSPAAADVYAVHDAIDVEFADSSISTDAAAMGEAPIDTTIAQPQAEDVEQVKPDASEEPRQDASHETSQDRARARLEARQNRHAANASSRRASSGRAGARRASNVGIVADLFDRYHRQLLIVGAVLLVFAAIGLLDTAVNWGKIYSGVHIGEIDVSGLTVEEAAAAVDGRYGKNLTTSEAHVYADEATFEKAKAGVQVEEEYNEEDISAEDAAKSRKSWTTNATELEARIYPQDIAEQALRVGREDGGIQARFAAQTFGWNIEPAVQMSNTALESLARSIDRTIGNAHVDYGIDLSDGVAAVTPGHEGEEVDRSELRAAITDQLLGIAEEPGYVAHAEHADIRVSRETAQELADKINAGIAQGATFQFEGASWEASTYDLAMLIQVKKRQSQEGDWSLEASYDEAAAKAAILSNLTGAYSKQNIKIQFVKSDDGVMVTTNATGTMPEMGKAIDALTQDTLDSAPTTTPIIQMEGTQIPASMSIEAAMDYGIVSTISSYETEYTGGATNRNTNIHLAADLIDDSIVKADGGTWSFNEVAGECNEEKGFKGAGTIVGGEIVDDVGGGICQVATTVFNAVFEAGLPVDERSNHSLYIASYPAGRDAAVSWPDLDLRWHNDTASDILLQTSYTDTTITVTLLGVDPGYTVTSEEGEFKDGAKHTVRTEVNDELAQGETQVKQSGLDGTSIEVTRTVTDASGNIVRKDTFTSVYDAKDEIIEVGPNTDIDLSLYEEDGDVSESSSSEDSEDDDAESAEGEEDYGYYSEE